GAICLVAGPEVRGGRHDHRLRQDVELAAAREREDLRLAGALEKIQALERLRDGGADDQCAVIAQDEDRLAPERPREALALAIVRRAADVFAGGGLAVEADGAR